jgi:hypothetical protein
LWFQEIIFVSISKAAGIPNPVAPQACRSANVVAVCGTNTQNTKVRIYITNGPYLHGINLTVYLDLASKRMKFKTIMSRI